MKLLSPTNPILGPCRFSYTHVFQPRKEEMRGGEEWYSVVLMIPKAPHQFCPDPLGMLKELNGCIKAALIEKFKEVPPKWETCLKDGDVETDGQGQPKYPGHYFMSARSEAKFPPITVDGERLPITGGWESGDWGKVSVVVYGYEFQGKKGVSLSLRAVQFLYKDEHFGTERDPAAIAQQFDAEPDAHASGVTASATVADIDPAYDPFALDA